MNNIIIPPPIRSHIPNEHLLPFSIEQAKLGAPVVDDYGNSVRIICYDKLGELFPNGDKEYPIVALITNDIEGEQIRSFTELGAPIKNRFFHLRMRPLGYLNDKPIYLGSELQHEVMQGLKISYWRNKTISKMEDWTSINKSVPWRWCPKPIQLYQGLIKLAKSEVCILNKQLFDSEESCNAKFISSSEQFELGTYIKAIPTIIGFIKNHE